MDGGWLHVCVFVCVVEATSYKYNGRKNSLMSFMSTEFGAVQRSRCLDSGRAIMGFGQITVITLVVVIPGGFLG